MAGQVAPRQVIVMECPLFRESATRHFSKNPRLAEAFAEFIKTKISNPIAPYGPSDKADPAGTPITLYVPKMRHAHLSHDVSIFYTVSGNPTELKLYAVASHDEAGTGQPRNLIKVKSMGKRMSNQDFAPTGAAPASTLKNK